MTSAVEELLGIGPCAAVYSGILCVNHGGLGKIAAGVAASGMNKKYPARPARRFCHVAKFRVSFLQSIFSILNERMPVAADRLPRLSQTSSVESDQMSEESRQQEEKARAARNHHTRQL